MGSLNELILPSSTLALLGVIVSGLLVVLQVKIFHRFGITQHIKPEKDSFIKPKKWLPPIMGGISIIVPFLVFQFILYYLFPSSKLIRSIIVITAINGLIGLIDDILDFFNKRINKRIYIYSASNCPSYLTWKIKTLLKLPHYILYQLLRPFSSYTTGLPPYIKLFSQILAALWAFNIIGISNIIPHNYQFLPFQEYFPPLLLISVIILITVLWANAFNITDGIDTISPLTQLVTFVGLLIIAVHQGNYTLAISISFLLGSILAFYYFNIFPARIEMSDVGTQALGSLFAYMSTVLGIIFLTPFFAATQFVNILSVVLQVLSVKLRGKRLFPMAPLHHTFEIIGWSREKIVFRAFYLQMVGLIVGLILYSLLYA